MQMKCILTASPEIIPGLLGQIQNKCHGGKSILKKMSFVSKSNYNLSSNLPPSLVITTTVELGPAPLGLITCMETRYWV